MTSPRIPLVLKMADWPEADRQVWDSLFETGVLFEDEGPCIRWSDGTRRMRRQGYGQWLSFILRNDPEAASLLPGDRITPHRVEDFISESEARLRPRSVMNLIVSVAALARAMAPSHDWAWLWRAADRLRLRANQYELKPRHPLTASDIFLWSLRHMAEVNEYPELTPLLRAVRFRQALMIGTLIACPVRSRAFIGMTLSSHVVEHDDAYDLQFSAADMKDKKSYRFSLAPRLVPFLRHYLEIHRPVLLQGKISNGLWINRYGNPLTRDGFTRELPNLTLRHLGVPLRPHAFRHIAATSVAEEDPAHVGIIRDILGHATLNMSERHYNRASANLGCSKLQSVVRDFRRKSAKMRKQEHLSKEDGTSRKTAR